MINKEVPSLTGLRGLAAGLVFLAHATQLFFTFQGSYWLVYIPSRLGITIFFVLSGFVLTVNYINKVQSPRDIAMFFISRFARLYPLYICFFIFFAATSSDFFQQFNRYMLTMTASWFFEYADSKILNLSNLRWAWTIPTEFFFYLMFPLLTYLLTYRFRKTSVYIFGIFLFSLLELIMLQIFILYFLTNLYIPAAQTDKNNFFLTYISYFGPYLRICEFIVGMFVAKLYLYTVQNANFKEKMQSILLPIISVALLALILVVLRRYNNTVNLLYYGKAGVIYILPVAIFVFACAVQSNFITKILNARPFIIFGDISYGFYMFHFQFLCYFKNPYVSDNLQAVLCVLLAFALSSFLAYGSYYLFEQPVSKSIRNFAKKKIL